MKKESTKDKILESALTLFAERGYDGVSVDQIAADVGLKGPSLYKHYKGKEEILHALIEMSEKYYEARFGVQGFFGVVPKSVEEFISITMKKVDFTMHDPMVRKMRKLMAMEQFRNPRIAEIATKHQVEIVQRMFQVILYRMMQMGVIRDEEPKILAMEYILPISVLIQVYDRQPEKEEEVLEKIEAHVHHFVRIYANHNEKNK